MSNRVADNRGFTLIELVLSAAVVLVVGAALLMVYMVTSQGLAVIVAKAMTTNQLRSGFERLGRDIAGAQDAPASICGGSFALSDTTLILVSDAGQNVIYRCLSGGTCNASVPGNNDALERLVKSSDCSADVEPPSVAARGVFSLGFTRKDRTPGDLTDTQWRIDVRLGISNAVLGQRTQGEIVDLFNMRN